MRNRRRRYRYEHDDACRERPHRRHRARPIRRVIRGLSERFGVDRGLVIAGFVAGFVFVPLLTALLFVAAWVWVTDPVRFEDAVSGAVGKVRAAYRGLRASLRSAPPPPPEPDPPEPEVDFPALRRRFEDLERRAGRMEGYVSSEAFSVDRGFRDLDAERGR